MSALQRAAALVHTTSGPNDVNRRVGTIAVGVPVVVLFGGGALSALDLRFGLVAAAVVVGWTKLVGL